MTTRRWKSRPWRRSRGKFSPRRWGERPFRAPHHTASAVALVGGGSDPRPGEISLAHHGVLFLDELPEWDRRVLEVLREPLESGVIHISRAARQSTFPAQFQLVAAMNPCPCGWQGDPRGRCHCTPDRVARYRARISGPLLDRIDLALEVPAVDADLLAIRANVVGAEVTGSAGSAKIVRAPERESSATVRARVVRARERQHARQGKANAHLTPPEIAQYCAPDAAGEALLRKAMARLALSARAYHRVLKVARTVADLAGARDVAVSTWPRRSASGVTTARESRPSPRAPPIAARRPVRRSGAVRVAARAVTPRLAGRGRPSPCGPRIFRPPRPRPSASSAAAAAGTSCTRRTRTAGCAPC